MVAKLSNEIGNSLRFHVQQHTRDDWRFSLASRSYHCFLTKSSKIIAHNDTSPIYVVIREDFLFGSRQPALSFRGRRKLRLFWTGDFWPFFGRLQYRSGAAFRWGVTFFLYFFFGVGAPFPYSKYSNTIHLVSSRIIRELHSLYEGSIFIRLVPVNPQRHSSANTDIMSTCTVQSK